MSKKKKSDIDEKSPVEENNLQGEKRKEKELYWVLGTMVSLVVVFLIASSVFKSVGSFEYQGLEFTRDKIGDIPLFRHAYHFTDPIGITGQVINEPRQVFVYLRNDPRENNVPLEGGEIVFGTANTLFVTVNATDLTQCQYTSVGLAMLSNFLSSNLIPTKGAMPDKELAQQANVTYASCEDNPGNQVILIQSGDETKVTRQSSRCYTIQASNCEIIPAVEKFIVQSLVDAKARKENK